MVKYSVHEAVDKHIENIDKLMGNLTTEIEKHKDLEQVHCGHVGDLAYVEELLALAWEFIAETTD